MELVQPGINSLRSGQSLDWSLNSPIDLITAVSSSQLDMFTVQPDFQGAGFGYQFGGISNSLWTDQPTQDLDVQIQSDGVSPISPTTETSSVEVRSLFADIVGTGVDPDSPEYPSKIASELDNVLIECEEGELVKNIKKMVGPSVLESSFQLLRYSVYLSSNNLLSTYHTDKLLQWVVESGKFSIIDRLIRMKKSSTEVFASNLLVSAARKQYVKIVHAFIALGIDINIPGGGQDYKTTALYEAAAKRDINLVMILLEAGADPNRIGPHQAISPLQKAVETTRGLKYWRLLQARAHVDVSWEKDDLELCHVLLKAGVDVNIAPVESFFTSTILLAAVLQCNAKLVTMLLDWKAHVNHMTKTSMTALQGAAKSNNIEIAQLLLDGGADVDAPAGKKYKTARIDRARYADCTHLISPIQYAAFHNNTEMVQIFLDAGANVDGYLPTDDEYSKEYYDDIDEYSTETPLQWAVRHENTVLVRQLLLAGAKIDGLEYGPTPLQIAAEQGSISLVKLLLRKHASINANPDPVERNGKTALQAAAENGNYDLVKILIDTEAHINAQAGPIEGRTTLQAAVYSGDIELIDALIGYGADVNAEPSPVRGRTCLQAAAEIGNCEMIQIFLNHGADINAPAASENGRTALQAALEKDHMSAVEILLEAGADINAAPSKTAGLTALFASVKCQNLRFVERLLLTANPNKGTSRESPLMKAIKRGSSAIVQGLIRAGANVNYDRQKNYYPRTALETAIKNNRLHIVHDLLTAGADINGPTFKDGISNMSPLEVAVHQNNIEIVKLLLSKGAKVDLYLENSLPQSTALCCALQSWWWNEEIIRLLVAAGADVNRASHRQGMPLSIGARNIRVVQTLLLAGAKVNGSIPGGTTALQTSIMSDNIDIVQMLLDAGADVNAPAPHKKFGKTALQAAASRGKVPIVRLLLRYGADLNISAYESHGVTALQAAVISGHLPVVMILLKAGADINAPAAKIGGRTALEAAAEHGRLDMVSLFLKNDGDPDSLELRRKRAAELAIMRGNIFISMFLTGYGKV